MNIGDKMPLYLGKDAEGNEVRTSDFKGKKLIVYFYPKDNTPGCSAEACSLRDGYEQFLNMGYVVVGVSKGSETSHRKFAAKYSLPFVLIADTDHRLCEEFGVWQLKKMAGREYMGIVRTTFVADENGVVTDIIRKVDTKNAAAQLFSLLEGRNSLNPA